MNKRHIGKDYNKLGSYLHTPTIKQQLNYSEKHKNLREFLKTTIEELRPLVDCCFDNNFGEVFTIECESCQKSIPLRKEGLAIKEKFSCLYSSCNMQYPVLDISEDNELIYEALHLNVPCSCGETNKININDLESLYVFNCMCGKKHFLKKDWFHNEQ